MKLSALVEQAQAAIPQPYLTGINWSAFFGAVGWVFGTVVPAIVGVLSGCWLGCQLWLFFKTKPWRKKP